MSGIGLDAAGDLASIQRYILFTVDGPSAISGEVSNASGRVRICLWRGNQVENQVCRNIRNGTFLMTVGDAGSTNWTFSLIGRDVGVGPSVDFTLGFNSNAPSVDFENFRFQGEPQPNYNGITAAIDTTGAGEIRVDGSFDPGQQHQYRVVISEAGVGAVKDETGGPANSFTVTQEVATETSYLVQLTNPSDTSEPGPVFLRATISWT